MMIALAMQPRRKNISLKEISKAEGISEKYLGNLVAPLREAGFVAAGRGSRGGFSLSRPAEEITLHDIVATLEGSRYSVVGDDDETGREQTSACVTRDVWRELGEKIVATLDGITLEEMANRRRRRMNAEEAMYYI